MNVRFPSTYDNRRYPCAVTYGNYRPSSTISIQLTGGVMAEIGRSYGDAEIKPDDRPGENQRDHPNRGEEE